ncbi:MAG: hypothetical protein ACJAS1_004974 [Oleiphilaceae bacterium]|jgi:hypothetical protein
MGAFTIWLYSSLGAQTDLELLLYLSVDTIPFTLAFSQTEQNEQFYIEAGGCIIMR